MRYGKSGFCGLVYLIALSGPSVAQNANDLINIFGGLARSGIAMATQSAWEKLPSSEIACIDQTLRQRGSSINLVIQQAIGPSDARIFDVRSACRNQLTEQSPRLGPSFDCAKATFADERAICSNSELSQLDNVVAAAYRYVRDQSGEQAARSISGPSLQFRRACNADVTCIKQVQISSIRDYQNRGAPLSYSETAPARPLSVHPEYVVDGLSLGANVQFNSVSYREYRCRPSEQFAGFAFCQKQREQREARGPYTASNSILHSADGTAVYINRYLEPAFFDGDEAKADISRLSKKLGSPHVIPMPANSDVPNGMIVSWGNVVLESLDPAALKDLAEGKDVRAGFMIDHIGNLRRSARTGLPIYRLRGAAGYVWAASWNANGRGTLQFLTIDASSFANEAASVPSDLPKPSSDTSDAKKPVAEKTPAEQAEEARVAAAAKTAADKKAAEKAAAEKMAAEKAVEDKAAAEKAAAERAAAVAQAVADKAAKEAEIEAARKNEFNRKGLEYAGSSNIKWNVARTKNEMTDRTDVVVRSIQKNEEGLVVDVEGYCKNAEVAFSALVVDENGKPNVRLVGRTALGDGSIGYGVPAFYRVNDLEPHNTIVPELEFINKLQIAVFVSAGKKSESVENNIRLMMALFGAQIFLNSSDTWRVMVALKTDKGEIIVKVPLLDSSIQELFQSCR